MFDYLRHGWMTHSSPKKMRAGVLDGAIDAAAYLFQAGVSPQAVAKVALRMRALTSILSAPRRAGSHTPARHTPLSEHEVQALHVQAEQAAERHLALQSFVCDCLDSVKDRSDLQCLFLHMVHISRMMQVLRLAKLAQAKSGTDDFAPSTSPAPKRPGGASRARV